MKCEFKYVSHEPPALGEIQHEPERHRLASRSRSTLTERDGQNTSVILGLHYVGNGVWTSFLYLSRYKTGI